MSNGEDKPIVSSGTILQLPTDQAVDWVKGMLDTSAALQILFKHFKGKGYEFYFERAKVFVHSARDVDGRVVPSVLGILPSFVPATAADSGHLAVGISIHHSGYAIATSVNVGHQPFGVTEFTLHEIDPLRNEIITSTLSADAVVSGSVAELAKKLHPPAIARATADTKEALPKGLASFTVMSTGDQGLLIGAVVQQLLADNYSRALFPPEYARALSMQTPTFQKFAFAARERFAGTVLAITLSTSTSTSSNICTSTSTSTIEL